MKTGGQVGDVATPAAGPALDAEDAGANARRTHARSPVFFVAPSNLRFLMDHTGFIPNPTQPGGGTRFFVGEIHPAALDMIGRARRHILISLFLFDSFYAANPGGQDLVGAYTDALLRKKAEHPDIAIAVILDESHRAYGRRLAPAERLFRAHGIDVFYSDLLSGLRRGALLGIREGVGRWKRGLDRLTGGVWGSFWGALLSRVRIPARFDGEWVSLESVYNALLFKANHRKLVVTDDDSGEYEALVTSANPHNASASHINTGIVVRGAPARFIYNLLRADLRQSVELGRSHAHWHDAADLAYRQTYLQARFPAIPHHDNRSNTNDIRHAVSVTVVTESAIRDAILDALARATTGDEIRIQMFYLSFRPILDAILDAAVRGGCPVRLLLDANKDAFNMKKDGTPNRQVARFMLAEAARRGARVEIRWYATRGEQNHAKIMSITNPRTGRYFLTTGSCNWTGRNIEGINMEVNLTLENARACVEAFNSRFDLFWNQSDGRAYSLPYETFRDRTAADWKWRIGERPYYCGLF